MTFLGRSVVVLFLFFSFLFLSNAQAYYVDSPHNESNGIYCYMCHNNSAWYWGDPNNNTGDIDVTIKNYICLSCHGENPDLGDPWVREAPTKGIHSSSTTSNTYGTWSTECTDCHDPHIQPQLEWANTDPGAFWLAEGFLDYSFGESPTFNPGDPDGQGYGATTFGISFISGGAGWTDPLTWSSKGGNVDITRAVDNSRGLIFVPNKGAPTETFEILNAVLISPGNYRLKVKGQVTSVQEFVTFGVFYGQSLNSSVINPNDLIPRNVKFFQPTPAASTYGGMIDNTPASLTPSGICQVCHTQTFYWNSNGSNSGHNNSNDCNICHGILLAGFAAVNAPDHSNMVIPHPYCSGCHTAWGFTVDSNDPKVHNSCGSCHNPGGSLIDPATSSLVIAMPAGGAANNDGGGTCYVCHGNYFANHTNIDHLTPNWVAPLPLCTTACHTNTAGTLTGAPVASQDVKVHDYCYDCHNTNGSLKTFGEANKTYHVQPRIIAMPAGGGDCGSCHGADYFDSHVHGLTVPTYNYAYHSLEGPTGTNLTATQNCLSANCHVAPDTKDPYTDPGMLHAPKGCDTCHNLSGATPDGQLKTGTYGDATASSAGIDANGKWECGECHTGYFQGHADRDSNSGTFAHDVLMRGTDLAAGQPCNNCHKRGGTGSGNPNFINEWAGTDGINGFHNGCDTCHTSGRLKDTSGAGVQDVIQNGTLVGCLDCHAGRNSTHIDHLLNDQDGDLVMAIEESPQCTSCHNGGGVTTTLSESNLVAIHAGDCGTCHQDPAGSGPLHDYSGTGGTINDNINYETLNNGHGGVCITCHVRYANNFETAHQVADHLTPGLAEIIIPYVSPETGTPTCTFNCHNGSSLNSIMVEVHGDGLTSTCTNCHTDMLSDGSLRIDPPPEANGDATKHAMGTVSNCSTCHFTNSWTHEASNTGFNHTGKISLTDDGTCETCHTPVDQGYGVEYELFWTLHTNQICGGCHNLSDGFILKAGWDGTGTAENGPGDCKLCHPTHANTFYDHEPPSHARVVATSDGTCETCHVAEIPPFQLPAGVYDPPGVTIPASGEVHSKIMCFTCHDSGSSGVLIGSALNHTSGINSDCNTCHVDRVNGHDTEHGNIAYEDSPSQETNLEISGNCYFCHDSMGFPDTTSGHLGRLITTGAIHGGSNIGQTISCSTCHDSAVPAVANTIADARGGAPTNVPASCADCHGPRPVSHNSFHNDTHFSWDGNCVNCHTGTNVVSDVHQDKCEVCHTVPVTIDYSRRTGTNGDATLGSLTSACSVCHAPGTYPTPVIHHGSTSAVAGNCTVCHPASDHTNMVQNYVNCSGCHSAVGNTVDPGDPKVHNACISCHNTDSSLIDPATSTMVTAMPVGGAATNDGGGTCYSCHNAYFSNHTNIDHLTPVWVAPLPLCTTYCHTGTVGTTTTVPVSGTDPELHDYCTNCHNANGTLKTFSQADINNPDRIIAMAPGDCSACHRTDYFESHIHGIGEPIHYPSVHSMEEPTGTNLTLTQNCLSANCHAVTDSRGPYITAGQVHEPRGCDTCHDLSGPNVDAQLRAAPYGDATVNSFGIDVNGDWECGECHYNHFDGHADRNANTGTFAHDVLMRGSDLAFGLPCNDCHRRGGTFSANPNFINEWAGTDGINGLHGGCDTCHTSGRLGDTSAAGIQDIIQNAIGVGCLDCHASRNSAHIDHLMDDQDADLMMALEESPQCTSCHNAGATLGSLTETNMIAIHGGSCGTCHQNPAGSGPLHDYSGTGGNINDNVYYETLNGGHGGTCVTCHVRYGNNFETGHQVADHRNPALDASIIPYIAPSTTPTCTYNCHDGSSLSAILINEHGDGLTSTCTNCHSDMLNDGSLRVALPSPTPNGDAREHVLGTASDCSTCHSVGQYPWGHDAGNGPTNFNHIGRVNPTADNSCMGCHDKSDPTGNGFEDDLLYGLHSANCGLCHDTGDGLILKAGWDGLGTAEFGSGDCKHCHSAPNGPIVATHPATHDLTSYEDSPVTQETNPMIGGLCGTCHDYEGFADPEPAIGEIDIVAGHVGRVVVTGALGTLVGSYIDCWTCHSITSGPVEQAIRWGRVDGGAIASCADCHGPRPTPHP